MKLVLICLLLCAPHAFAERVPVEVTAKVIEMPKQVGSCGYFVFTAVVRFEVLSVVQGKYPPKKLLGVYRCPQDLRVGAEVRLRLDKPATGTYRDDFKAHSGTRWVVTHVAEPPVHITAKIVELPKRIIACGQLAFQAVVRYEVISVDQGTYDHKDILVVEMCPEFRKLGEKRTLKLRPMAFDDDSFDDDFKATPGLRWGHVE